MHDGEHRNSRRPCNAPGCHFPRHRLNAQCLQHLQPARTYGHPMGRPVPPAWLAHYRQQVGALFSANPSHAGLLQATEFLRGWMAKATADHLAYRGAEEMARLLRLGVSPRAVLVELVAIQAWLVDNPRFLPDDRSRDFAISRAIFGLAPRPRTPTRRPDGGRALVVTGANSRYSTAKKARVSALSNVGQFLRQTLSTFSTNVLLHLEQIEQQRRQQQQAQVDNLKAPFELPR
jgi:hypothetical protein